MSFGGLPKDAAPLETRSSPPEVLEHLLPRCSPRSLKPRCNHATPMGLHLISPATAFRNRTRVSLARKDEKKNTWTLDAAIPPLKPLLPDPKCQPPLFRVRIGMVKCMSTVGFRLGALERGGTRGKQNCVAQPSWSSAEDLKSRVGFVGSISLHKLAVDGVVAEVAAAALLALEVLGNEVRRELLASSDVNGGFRDELRQLSG